MVRAMCGWSKRQKTELKDRKGAKDLMLGFNGHWPC